MAINTDAAFERSVSLNEGGGTSDFGDTQKLLGVTVTEGKEGLDRSCSESRRASVKSTGADQVSHTSGATGEPQSPPLSPEPDVNAPEPRSYMWLALLSCFCPAVPFNVFAIYFAHAVSLLLILMFNIIIQRLWLTVHFSHFSKILGISGT